MIKQLKFASIPTRDQEAALKFWTERCGFEVATDQPMGPEMEGRRWIELRVRNGSTRIALFTPPGNEDRVGTFSGLSFECDDVEKTYEELVKRGVAFVQSPQKEGWGTSAVFADPDGNQFVLSSR
ncbi:MAG TPA: VOC family protein [Candidatus Cybelea sp.]|jgi:predicted enzyme related to lactoylglutathione lyase